MNSKWWEHRPVWALPVLLAMPLRLPLVFLPGPGRDEAAYYYWAIQGDLDYAPLMVAWVRALDAIAIPPLAAIRLPSVIGGFACLILFARFLEAAGASRRLRVIAVTALALTPWQTLVGSVLHPDTLLLGCLLGASDALLRRRPWAVAIWGGAAALAKPTGLLIAPVLVIGLWQMARGPSRWRSPALLLGLAAVAAAGLSMPMVREISQFGRLDPSMTVGQRLGVAAAGAVVQGGLVLPAAAGLGIWQRLRTPRRPPETFVFLVAITLVGAFTVAAFGNDQAKGNWMLPAFVLLWPTLPGRARSGWVIAVLLVPALASMFMVTAMRLPDRSASVESRLGLDSIYPRLAGAREQRVSPTRTFSQRFREFHDMAPLADAVLRHWQTATGAERPPRWIVSDDYGLATQLAYHWRHAEPRVVVPGDGMFQDGLALARNENRRLILVVGCLTPVSGIWPERGPIERLAILEHPVTDGFVEIGVCSP